MKIQKLEEHVRPAPHHRVRVKSMRNYTEIRYTSRKMQQHIKKLDSSTYLDLSTGEIKEFHHGETRADNVISVRQSMSRLRDLIRANICHPSQCRWTTLTYAENMTDILRLYDDFRTYNQRFQRYLRREHDTKAEYIAIAEPQGRGAWHLHVLYFFPNEAPFIPNKELAALWGHGFVSVKALKGGDDVAMYLTAYLTDMPLEESGLEPGEVRRKDLNIVRGEDGEEPKAYVKGARMRLYPVGMRLYRCSRGIRKPFIVNDITEKDCQKIIEENGFSLTYEKTIQLSTPRKGRADYTNTINYRLYHKEMTDNGKTSQ